MSPAIPIQSGRIEAADIKDGRQGTYYLPSKPVLAVLCDHAVLDATCYTIDAEAGTIQPRYMAVGSSLRFLVQDAPR